MISTLYRTEEEAVWGYILNKLGYHAAYHPKHHCFRTNGGVLCRGSYDTGGVDMVIIVGDFDDDKRTEEAVALAEKIAKPDSLSPDDLLWEGLGLGVWIVDGAKTGTLSSRTEGKYLDSVQYYNYYFIDGDEFGNWLGVSKDGKLEVIHDENDSYNDYDGAARFEALVVEAREHIKQGFSFQ